jgi:DNA-binding CsgD family transcriptional regulator
MYQMAELLERDQALGHLDSILKLVGLGTGRTVLASGEAGIGKTSLVERFADRHRGETRILWGACEALFTPRPLGPLYDIASQLPSDLLSLLESNAPRPRIFGALLGELQPGRRPSVVVIEDVHWADEATLDLVKFLGRRITRTSALLILTYRDDEVGPRHPLRLLLGDLPGGTLSRVPLAPLSEAAVEMLARKADRPAAGVYAVTGGNPFFVTEVLASATPGVPPTVRDAVLARAERLPPSARSVLDVAAAIGAKAEAWLLQAVAGDGMPAVEEAVSRGLLRPVEGGFSFRHELARQAILDTLPPARAAALHKAILDALRSSPAGPDDLARLAHHADAAGDGEAVLQYAPVAGDRAAALGAHREAAAQYVRAIRFAHALEPSRGARLFESYAMECTILDRLDEGIRARQKAIELFRTAGDRLKEGENLARLGSSLVFSGRTAEGEQAARRAIEILESLPASPELATAYRIQAGLRMLNRDTHEAVAWGEKALALAKKFGVTESIVSVHNAIGSALLTAGNDEGRRYLETSRVLAEEAGLEVAVAGAHLNLGSALGEQHRFREAEKALTAGISYAAERDFDQNRNYMMAWRGLVYMYLGRWDEAAGEALAVLSRPGIAASTRIMALVALGRLRARRGDPDVMSPLDEALHLAEQTATLQRVAPVRTARAEAAWLAGRSQAVIEEARAAFDLAARHEHAWFIGELGFWRWRAGDLEAPPPSAAPPFRLQMEGNWRDAAEAWAQMGCPYEQARALADGDAEAGRKALLIFQHLGARPAAELVRRNMRAQGIRGIPRGPRASTMRNPAKLSARELEVLLLLAQGLQNAEIASRLVLSFRTVDHHVSAVLAKLDARSRAEAVAAAYRLGILQS